MTRLSRLLAVFFSAFALAFSIPAYAADFTASTRVSEATVYPLGATATRRAQVELPTGSHVVRFSDIPQYADLETMAAYLNTRVTGARMGQVTVREIKDAAPTTDRARAALADVTDAEEAYEALEKEAAFADGDIQAAQDSLDFLARLSNEAGGGAEDLAATAAMIQTQSVTARRAMIEARAARAQIGKRLELAATALEAARMVYAEVFNENTRRVEVSVPVVVNEAGPVGFTFTERVQSAEWRPHYRLSLDSETSVMRIERGVKVRQMTGAAWEDVTLSFATQAPSFVTGPREVHPFIRRVGDPQDIMPMPKRMTMSDDSAFEAMSEPIVVEEAAATVSFVAQGLNARFALSTPVTLLSTQAASDFALDPLELAADVVVRAVPLYEDFGFVVAKVTNATGVPLLPGDALLSRDGALIGETAVDLVTDGQSFEVGFGRVDGLRIDRVILDANEGDRGIIRKSNEETRAVRIEVENLTDRAWPVEVIDRVSVSEQEDLEIEWEASVPPTVVDREYARGVLEWRFDLEPSEFWSSELIENLRWPEGQILR